MSAAVRTENGWLPKASCDAGCVAAGLLPAGQPVWVALRSMARAMLTLVLLPGLVVLAVPLPGRSHLQRGYCRLVLRCLGVRITVSGGPIRNLSGVLVVSRHVSWMDIFAIGAVLPGSFVAKSEVTRWPGLGALVRLMKVIPIDRGDLRRLPAVVAQVATRLRAGHTVVAFPEGTTWCGLGHGPFRPALFQAAVDAGRPVQPLRLTYHHRDGRISTAPAYVGDDSLWTSICRVICARRTIAHVQVQSLQLPGAGRRELAARCERAVRGPAPHPALPVVALRRHVASHRAPTDPVGGVSVRNPRETRGVSAGDTHARREIAPRTDRHPV